MSKNESIVEEMNEVIGALVNAETYIMSEFEHSAYGKSIEKKAKDEYGTLSNENGIAWVERRKTEVEDNDENYNFPQK